MLTRLGPIASGGRQVESELNLCQNRRAEVGGDFDVGKLDSITGVECNGLKSSAEGCCDGCPCKCCSKLKKEIVILKENLRNCELADEAIQPSKTDEFVRRLVESYIKLVDERYEIPVPLKNDVVEKLSHNFVSACERTVSLRRKALKDPQLKHTLVDTFRELLDAGWLVPVDKDSSNNRTWYLPFFVTKQDKPRVVFDGGASFKGVSLNDAVLAGENLLNNLVEVLMRFCLGKYACMADLSKCFFQIAMPVHQQDLFRLVWYSNNDIDEGVTQVFRFTRHVWGINSSPFVALYAIEYLVSENPTDASHYFVSY